MASEMLTRPGLNTAGRSELICARPRHADRSTFLRTDDIPVLCAEGAIDMGITGGDLIAESGVELVSRLSLGMGNWKLAICVPERVAFAKRATLRQTNCDQFPRVTQAYLDSTKSSLISSN